MKHHLSYVDWPFARDWKKALRWLMDPVRGRIPVLPEGLLAGHLTLTVGKVLGWKMHFL